MTCTGIPASAASAAGSVAVSVLPSPVSSSARPPAQPSPSRRRAARRSGACRACVARPRAPARSRAAAAARASPLRQSSLRSSSDGLVEVRLAERREVRCAARSTARDELRDRASGGRAARTRSRATAARERAHQQRRLVVGPFRAAGPCATPGRQAMRHSGARHRAASGTRAAGRASRAGRAARRRDRSGRGRARRGPDHAVGGQRQIELEVRARASERPPDRFGSTAKGPPPAVPSAAVGSRSVTAGTSRVIRAGSTVREIVGQPDPGGFGVLAQQRDVLLRDDHPRGRSRNVDHVGDHLSLAGRSGPTRSRPSRGTKIPAAGLRITTALDRSCARASSASVSASRSRAISASTRSPDASESASARRCRSLRSAVECLQRAPRAPRRARGSAAARPRTSLWTSASTSTTKPSAPART